MVIETEHKEAGGPSLHCTIPTEGAPSLRFLQGWAAMLPAQLLSVLHHLLCMPSSYRSFAKYAKYEGEIGDRGNRDRRDVIQKTKAPVISRGL